MTAEQNNMVTQAHYDKSVLDRFLDDNLHQDDQHEVSRHVESCTICQGTLEQLAETALSWNDVRSYLGTEPGVADLAGQAELEQIKSIRLFTESDQADSLGRFGRYEVKEILGSGGMGIVLRGFDPALNRQSAVKILAPHLATNASARNRFAREAKSAAAVVHDHVIPIHTVDELDGLPYLVMPVVEGCSLEQRVHESGPLELLEILRIGMQVASGLAAAHEQGLVHRDVKPANILLAGGMERVMITDFGLARAADDANMTQSGVIAGTPQYMSPEQARGGEIDSRSDLFSLGSLLYFMCTGHSPFRAETTMGVLHRIVTEQPRPLSQVRSDIPDWFEGIVSRLLKKNKEGRFQTAHEIESLLGKWLAHLQRPRQVPAPNANLLNAPLNSYAEKSPRKRIGTPKSWSLRSFIPVFLICSLMVGAVALGTVFIVLELDKGTLHIKAASDAHITIEHVENELPPESLTLLEGDNRSLRLRAGNYLIKVNGDSDGIRVKNGTIRLLRGKEWWVEVTERQSGIAKTKAARETRSGESEKSEAVALQPSNAQPNAHGSDNALAEKQTVAKGAHNRCHAYT